MQIVLIAFCFGVWLLQQQATLPPASWAGLLPLLSAVLLLPHFSHVAFEAVRRFAVVLLCAALGFSWAAWRADLQLADRLPDSWQGVDLAGVEATLRVVGVHEVDTAGNRLDLLSGLRHFNSTGPCVAGVQAEPGIKVDIELLRERIGP